MGSVASESSRIKPGQYAEIVYDIYGPTVARAAELAAIEDKLATIQGIKYLGHSYPKDGENEIRFKVKGIPTPDAIPGIQQAGISVVTIVKALTVAGVATMVWLSFREVRLMGGPGEMITNLADSPAVKLVGLVLLGLSVLKILRKGKA